MLTLTLSPPIFTQKSWPPEYLVVWISDHAIHQNKIRPSTFKQNNQFYSSSKHCFFINTWMQVGFIKKQQFEQKAEKITCLSNTTSGSYSVILSKQRCSRWLLTLFWIHTSFCNIRQFSFICVSVDECIIFHMHMLYMRSWFLRLPHLCFWSSDSRLIQEMCNSAT